MINGLPSLQNGQQQQHNQLLELTKQEQLELLLSSGVSSPSLPRRNGSPSLLFREALVDLLLLSTFYLSFQLITSNFHHPKVMITPPVFGLLIPFSNQQTALNLVV